MRRVPIVVWKDFQDAVRSKMLWGIMGLLVGFVALLYAVIWWTVSDPDPIEHIVAPASAFMQLLVPIAALVVAYRSIVGERQTGSIKVLLSLPPSRLDVVVGKLIGRWLVLVTAIAASFLTFIVLSVVLFQSVPLVEFVALAAVAALGGAAFVGIAVGLSAAVNSRGQAMAGTIGLLFLLLLFWDILTAGVYRLLEGELPGGPQYEGWYVFLQWLNPLNAIGILNDAAIGESFGTFTLPLFAPVNPGDLEQAVAGDIPWYLTNEALVPILLAWAVIPVGLGYLRFRRIDLG